MFRNIAKDANLLMLKPILIQIGNRERSCFRLLPEMSACSMKCGTQSEIRCNSSTRKEELPLTFKIHLPRNVPWRQVLKNLGVGEYSSNEDGQINARNFSTNLWYASRIILKETKCLRLSQLLWKGTFC